MITDIVIPARGEGVRTLVPTIDAFRACKETGSIILVDDGLEPEVNFLLAPMIDEIVNGPGTGKGEAIIAGLPLVTTERVVLCDGDLMGFTSVHAEFLLRPGRGMLVGVPDPTPGHPPWYTPPEVRVLVTGERNVPITLLRGLDLHGYVMEHQINMAAYHAKLHTEVVWLTGCHGTPRWDNDRQKALENDQAWLRENPVT